MSFEFNQIGSFKPRVENTFLGKGGGGGNTGYFQQERKKKEDEKSILATFLSEDKLERMADGGMPNEEPENNILNKVKGLMGKFL